MAWTAPATFSTSEVVTATKLNTHLRDNMKEVWRRLAYVEFTSDVTAGAATEAAPLDVVSAGAITYTAEPIKIEGGAPRVTEGGGGGSFGVSLWDGTDLGRVWYSNGSAGHDASFITNPRYLTPTAAAHTYKLRCWGNGLVIRAGAGGVGVMMPGYIAVWQKGGA
jgi:hypothetical protein